MRTPLLLLTNGQVALGVVITIGLYALWDVVSRRIPRMRTERPVEPPCSTLEALDAVEAHLAALGYRRTGAEAASRVFERGGSLLSLRAIEGSHKLRVTATGAGLYVEVLGVSRLGFHDRRAFAERIDGMVKAAGAAGQAEAERAHAAELAASPIVHVVHEKTVERQVVVARCKYCGTLTPVDAKRCERCGADAFL